MNNNKRNILNLLISLFTMAIMGACSQEEIDTLANGTLRLSIGHAGPKAETRATPAQLGKPLADKFNLRVQRSGSDMVFYEGKFVSDLELKVGTYDITAYYGEDVVIGKDAPYYEGVATALIEEDKSTSVTISCRVANALVSVIFGRDEVERKRFDRFYSDYGLIVKMGDHSLALTADEVESSIYFPAGSTPTLIFYGTLKENDELVWCELSSTSLPVPFAAADHAIVTLNLPDPESALNVDITKVEVVTESMVETIPLSWLPLSTATAQHHYDEQGILVGTDVTFSNSYPGMTWKAVVTNANGEEVRIVEGTEGSGAELISSYSSSSEYPYLFSGDYKATFYLEDEGIYNKVGSRDFSVGKPELKLLLGGYSSYTKYLEGDIDAANECDRGSVYDISVALNVSETLLNKYPYTFTFQYGSMAVENVTPGKNNFKRTFPITGHAVSLTPYRLKADASFDGVSVNNFKDFYITGLPVTYAPPKMETGWKGSGTVSFKDDRVQLGENTVTEGQSIVNSDFAIPKSTKISLNYNISIQVWGIGTKLTVTLGEDVLFMKELGDDWSVGGTETPFSGTEEKTLTTAATRLECYNTYGAGQTYSCIRSLSLNYSK